MLMLALSTENFWPVWQVRQLVACGADVTITDQVRSHTHTLTHSHTHTPTHSHTHTLTHSHTHTLTHTLQDYGAIGMLQTCERFQRRGLGTLIVSALADQMQDAYSSGSLTGGYLVALRFSGPQDQPSLFTLALYIIISWK